jgi:hypothetical protein
VQKIKNINRLNKLITTFAQNEITMARPIKETPILFGKEARDFEARMKNPPKISEEKKKRMRAAYETALRMMVKN